MDAAIDSGTGITSAKGIAVGGGNLDSNAEPPCRIKRLVAWCAVAAMASGLTLCGGRCEADDADDVGAKPAKAKKPMEAPSGKLVICGGGVLPAQLRNRFIEFAGGSVARVVVITTASVYADTDKMEPKLTFWREQELASLTILHTRSRQTANDPKFALPLRDATGVWFVGGNQNWLTETYLGTVTEQAIRDVLARSGVVGGTSAGAAIMSPVMIRRDKPEVETGPGFGFLPGTVVDQHFLKRHRQGRLLKVLGSYPNLVGLGIDEGTAVVIDGNHLSVMGDSQVVVCSPATSDSPESVQSLDPGAEADLVQLRTLVAHVVMRPMTAAISPAPAAASEPAKPAPEAAGTSSAPEAASSAIGQ